MALPENLDINKMNEMVGSFHKESDRGAAILAGSFLEHYLGVYLRSLTTDKRAAEKLFDGMGPLATFSQRITAGFAFGFINKSQHADLELIRRVRNYFAHDPAHCSFASEEVQGRVMKLSTYGKTCNGYNPDHGRQVYLFACAVLCGNFESAMRRRLGSRATPS